MKCWSWPRKAEAADVMMELAQADMMALEGIGDFDAVTCYSDSLCHMADQEAVLNGSLKEFTLFSIKVVFSFLTFLHLSNGGSVLVATS